MTEIHPDVAALIPHRPPFLFVDEIVAETPEGLTARKTWRPEEDFYRGHYPGSPITPGVLLCEAVFQAGALYFARQKLAGSAPQGVPLLVKIGEVRFRQPVLPGDTVTMEVRKKETIGGFIVMTGVMKRAGQRVLNVEFFVAWKEPGAGGE